MRQVDGPYTLDAALTARMAHVEEPGSRKRNAGFPRGVARSKPESRLSGYSNGSERSPTTV